MLGVFIVVILIKHLVFETRKCACFCLTLNVLGKRHFFSVSFSTRGLAPLAQLVLGLD